MLPEVLRGAGYATFLSGKWHLLNAANTGIAEPFTNWPTSRGFDRAYWYQGHSSDYFKPGELFDSNAPVDTPQTDDYYLSDDLTTRAMTYVRTQTAVLDNRSTCNWRFRRRTRRCRRAPATAPNTPANMMPAGMWCARQDSNDRKSSASSPPTPSCRRCRSAPSPGPN